MGDGFMPLGRHVRHMLPCSPTSPSLPSRPKRCVGYPDAVYRAGRPSRDLDRPAHSMVRRGVEFASRTRSFEQRRCAASSRSSLLLAVALLVGPGDLAASSHSLPAVLHRRWSVRRAGQQPAGAAQPRMTHVAAVADGARDRRPRSAAGRRWRRSSAATPRSSTRPRVCRAAIESLAENFSDGVVAPLFWMVVAGLPGALAYKAINTADSMIGHKTERYIAFGWAAARFDDLVNCRPSRLSALWLVLAAVSAGPVAVARRWRGAARRAATTLAQCRLAGGGDGGRARRAAVGSAHL